MTATISVIESVRPHGDNLTIVTVAGNEVVANRKEDGSYRWAEGEICVYVAEGSIIPDDVLKARGYWDEEKDKGLLEGKKGNRVKMRRFAGHESRGLLFKVENEFNERVETPPRAELEDLIEEWNKYQAVLAEQIAKPDYDPILVQGRGMAFAGLWQKHSNYLRVAHDIKSNDYNYGSKTVIMPSVIASFEEMVAKPFVERGPEIGDDVTEFFGITEHKEN